MRGVGSALTIIEPDAVAKEVSAGVTGGGCLEGPGEDRLPVTTVCPMTDKRAVCAGSRLVTSHRRF